MRFLFGSTVMLLSCFLSFCCIHACDNGSGNDGGRGDGVDDGQTQDASDGEGDFADGGSDKADLGIPVQCSCRNPDDELVHADDRPTCMRTNYTCNALNPCDEGYVCWNICECQDLDICGIDCSSGCICPGGTVCDEKTDICRIPHACLSDAMCPEGQKCREPRDPHYSQDYYQCSIPSGGSTGQPCDFNWQCWSGVCDQTRVCLDACESNQDCPAGQLCHEAEHSTLGCALVTECGQSCSGDDEFCVNWNECRNDNCRTHADCPGDCNLDLRSPVIGRCTDLSLCEDDEIILIVGGGEFCLVYQACWTDLDCESPYRCTTELIGWTDGPNFCGRRVRGRCQEECPEGTVCDYRTASCTEALFCLENEMCPQGMNCIDGSPTIQGYTCATPRGGEVGEPCDTNSDCKSGFCHSNHICLQSCNTNIDCPAGQFCYAAGKPLLGCVEQTDCGSTCDGPDEFCVDECRNENCGVGADCPGDCEIYVTQPIIRRCVESQNCMDTEFLSRPVEFCMIHQSCRTDADCNTPYRCITGEEFGLAHGPSFCGRQP
jgi:hypothetical protein